MAELLRKYDLEIVRGDDGLLVPEANYAVNTFAKRKRCVLIIHVPCTESRRVSLVSFSSYNLPVQNAINRQNARGASNCTFIGLPKL